MRVEQDRGDVFDEARGFLPWTISAVVLIFGAARIDALRPQLAAAIAFAAPVVAATAGLYRFRGIGGALETCALLVSGLVVVAAEACVAGGLLGMTKLVPLLGAAHLVLALALCVALLLHTVGVRRGLDSRFGAWIGMAAAFAWYVSTHIEDDRFAVVFAGFFVALACGGLGLFVGEALRRFFRHG